MKEEHKNIQEMIEIISIIIQSDDYITAEAIADAYQRIHAIHANMYAKKVVRAIEKINQSFALDPPVIIGRQNKGYRVHETYTENYLWSLPLFSQYLSVTQHDFLNSLLEPIPLQVEKGSLYHLVLLNYAKQQRRPVRFAYVRYEEKEKTYKKVHVYALLQRRQKLMVIAKDVTNQQMKQYFFTGISEIEIVQDEQFPELDTSFIQSFYENSLNLYVGLQARKVVIKFSPESKNFLQKEVFHRNQKVYEKDGCFYVELWVNRDREVFSLVSDFMEYAELLEPLDWRDEYYRCLQKAVDWHKKKQ
ncbi:MAG: WYL domain-containing protein [Spirochaetota bacterium]